LTATASLAALAATGAWAGAGQPTTAAATSSASESAGASAASAEVTVTARRAELAPKVAAFVQQISEVANGEGLPRWQVPVCPLVAGLAREQGEFILGRVSEIAREAGVPLAGEQCRPNLYILVTAHPQESLQELAKRNYSLMFLGDVSPRVVDEFIATPRAVRVWYSSYEKAPEGTALSGGPGPGALLLGGSFGLSPKYNHWAQSSHLRSNVAWAFANVYVVVDLARLQAVSRGQLADYVGMVGLAQIKPDAHLGDAQTILRLFEGAPQSAPQGMSDWDRAFLKSLYATAQNSKVPRKEIARVMVREIAH